MTTVNYISGTTVIPADWLNDLDAFYYEVFGATGGKAYIGDTSNADMTIGLTINQLANTGQVLAFKSSSVAHGITDQAETDTYAAFSRFSDLSGGLLIQAFTESGSNVAICQNAVIGGNADTTRATSSVAPFAVRSYLKSGTNVDTVGANTNLMTIGDGATTRFIFDSDGDSHQDVGTAWTNFDHLDDVATLDALSYNVARPDDPIKRKFGEWMQDKRHLLAEQKIVSFNEDGHHFVNMSKLTMLHTGAIRQLGRDKADRSEVAALAKQISEVRALLGS